MGRKPRVMTSDEAAQEAPAKRGRPKKEPVANTNVNPDDVVECYGLYEEDMGQTARIKQRIASMLERYKKMGVPTDDVKFAYKMSTQDHPKAIMLGRLRTMKQLQIITSWDDDGQGSFVANLAVPEPSPQMAHKLTMGRIRADGYNSGLAGGSVDMCTHVVGSEEFVLWREGWSQGQSDRAELKPDQLPIKIASVRRSRASNDEIGEAKGSA